MSPDCYFSLAKPQDTRHSKDDDYALLSPGSIGPETTFQSYTPSSLSRTMLSPGSIEQPSFIPVSYALDSSPEDLLPSTHQFSNKSESSTSGSDHIGNQRKSDISDEMCLGARSVFGGGRRQREQSDPMITQTIELAAITSGKFPYQQSSNVITKVSGKAPHPAWPNSLRNSQTEARAQHRYDIEADDINGESCASLNIPDISREAQNSQVRLPSFNRTYRHSAVRSTMATPPAKHESEELEFLTEAPEEPSLAANYPRLYQAGTNDHNESDAGNTSSDGNGGNRRLGISEGHRDEPSASVPTQNPQISTPSTGRHSNVHAPVYNLSVLQEAPKVETKIQPKPSGRSRLQSLFHRTGTRGSGSGSARPNLKLDTKAANLSFLPTEAQKVSTPPASEAPRLNPIYLQQPAPVYFQSAAAAARQASVASAGRRAKSPMSRGVSYGNNSIGKQRVSPDEVGAAKKPEEEEDIFRSKWGNSNEGVRGTASVDVDSLPEHLTTAPICPRNPKHKSGGTGTCPYHGSIYD